VKFIKLCFINSFIVTIQQEYINRSPSQIPIWEGLFQKSFTLHYENHIIRTPDPHQTMVTYKK
jgi:hypothetical protein